MGYQAPADVSQWKVVWVDGNRTSEECEYSDIKKPHHTAGDGGSANAKAEVYQICGYSYQAASKPAYEILCYNPLHMEVRLTAKAGIYYNRTGQNSRGRCRSLQKMEQQDVYYTKSQYIETVSKKVVTQICTM